VTYSPKFVYESNGTSNDIWGYRVTTATGSLTALGSSPFATGASPQVVVSDLRGTFVFTANAGSNNVSAYAINSQTGALVPASGSPYAAGTQPSAVAVDNNAHYVYVTNSASNTISGYSVGPGGALTPVPGSPFAASGTGPRALVIDPRGKFVYVGNAQSNTVSIFQIDARTGALQNIAAVSAGHSPLSVAINRDGKYLYVLDMFGAVPAFAIDSVTGELLAVPGSPFGGSGTPNVMVVDPPGKRLYVGDVSTVVAYRIYDSKGTLQLLRQSPFAGVSDALGMSFDLADGFLYVANNSGNTVSGFQADKNSGNLRLLSDSPYPAGTNPTSVTVVSNFQ
jgi:YVTN family beta-propeller protein